MRIFASLLAVLMLVLFAYIGVGIAGMEYLFGVIVPGIAILVFLVGIILRVIYWARSPVPFRIPTTSGQQKSLEFIKPNNLESPHNLFGVLGRMFLEIFFFRSLFRNHKVSVNKDETRLVFGDEKWLWAAGLVFHYSFLIIVIRHFRFFVEPTPGLINIIESLDGFFELTIPTIFITDIFILAALTYLFLRRVYNPRLRFISLASDYFPLLLIASIAITGVLMRHFYKVDLYGVKTLAVGLFSLNPVVPEGIGVLFYIHLFLVSTLLVYFPFSKLLHMPGIFLSPTRNLANNNRVRRHVNPWDYEVEVHTYSEYEDEFRDLMREAGLPLEKDE